MQSKLPLLPSGPGGVRKSAFHGPWRRVIKPTGRSAARFVSRHLKNFALKKLFQNLPEPADNLPVHAGRHYFELRRLQSAISRAEFFALPSLVVCANDGPSVKHSRLNG